jgi:hypothetical protein
MRGSEASLVRAIRGPITLITLGVLFALNNFTEYHFHQTWPVLLIVFGLLSLMRRGAEPATVPPPPQWNFPPPENPAGGYRSSTYTGTMDAPASSGPAKGGFGTSAPQKPGDSGSGETA